MPTVISILNSYAGLSAVAMGFVLDNKLLIIAGALDGSSGLILSIIMCRAMNRSFTNVLFGAFGQVQAAKAGGEEQVYKSETIEGAAQVLEQASLVVIIPGYGMAVAQAQHRVRELYDQLDKRGITVKFAIHPVAGRMPGHMNVLLAEADIPYDELVEMDEINPDMPQCDVALVIGANDIVNPAARHDKIDAHLRHADHRRRQGQDRVRHQAQQEPRIRRHRQRALLSRPDLHAVRRRQGGRRRTGETILRRWGALNRGSPNRGTPDEPDSVLAMSRSFRDHFSPVASTYAAHRPGYPPELFASLASLCTRHDLAWDCACGSGQATIGLAAHFAHVVATDASAAQIAAAAPHPQVTYGVAAAESSGLAPRSVDLITVAQALHWLDLSPFYAEAKRVLVPEGVIAVWTYGTPSLADPQLNAHLQHFERAIVGPYWPPERRHVEGGYRDLPFPFDAAPAPGFEMTAAWRLPDLLGYLRTWSATTRCMAATATDPVAELATSMATRWGDGVRTLRWPLHLRVGRNPRS